MMQKQSVIYYFFAIVKKGNISTFGFDNCGDLIKKILFIPSKASEKVVG
ncbi:hypothetical protein [Pediococcus pentosaceus]|nr:hypothetical protein [Pediococcus pentosaceus]